MNILQLGSTDVMGSRFNGQDLHKEFVKRGLSSHHLVWEKKGQDPNTTEISSSRILKKLNHYVNRIEKRISIQSVLHPTFLWMLLNRHFLSSDIVHYHLIHTGFFSLLGLPLLSRMRPTVWTLHDPWAFTGHCIHPFECERWKTGCGECPNLSIDFSMNRDHSAFMWKIKKWSYALSKLDIVVASKWMLNKVQQSPLLSQCKVHHVPFGVDLELFKPGDTRLKKKQLGIREDNIVLCVRSTLNRFKGLSYILEALEKCHPKVPITILTFNERGHFDPFLGKYQIIDLGWVEDMGQTIDAYQASDIFIMPSVAESFGMMAMEAMSCGKPVITFEQTALSEVTFAPEAGIAVPYKNAEALASSLDRLIHHKEEREHIGARAREFAMKHYDINLHVNRLLEVYQNVLGRKK